MTWINEAAAGIRSFMELGGDVLWAIMFILFLMWALIFERAWYLFKVHPVRRREILADWESRIDTTSWYARQIRQGLVSQASLELKRHISPIKSMIAICPLLGLLGTVTGMISVFDVMTFSGSGNARALGAGVSMATVPTMAGMVAALSGVYFCTWLEHKANTESEKLEDLLQRH